MPLNIKSPVAIISIVCCNIKKTQLANKCVSSLITYYEYTKIISINKYDGLMVVIEF